MRYGRYTLVELAPAAQRDLLLQTIDVSMPEDARHGRAMGCGMCSNAAVTSFARRRTP